MGKNKTAMRVLGALLLVAVMAVLPMLTSALQDRATMEIPGLERMQAIELNFQKEIPGLGLLAMMCSGKMWQTADDGYAEMTVKEAEQAALDGLIPYQEAGLIDPNLDFYGYRMEPRVVTAPEDQANVVWNVVLVAMKNGLHVAEADLSMEDATGRIMGINFGVEDPIPQKSLERTLDTFAGIFFEQLGISDYGQAVADDFEGRDVGDRAVARHYRFGDLDYGEINVALYAYPNGFYVSFYVW